MLQQAEPLAQRAVDVAGVQLLTELVPAGVAANDLRTLTVNVRDRLDPTRPAAVLLASATDDRLSFVATVNKAGWRPAGRRATWSRCWRARSAPAAAARPTSRRVPGTPDDAPAAFEAVRNSLLSAAS